jgi:hypothetical protein
MWCKKSEELLSACSTKWNLDVKSFNKLTTHSCQRWQGCETVKCTRFSGQNLIKPLKWLKHSSKYLSGAKTSAPTNKSVRIYELLRLISGKRTYLTERARLTQRWETKYSGCKKIKGTVAGPYLQKTKSLWPNGKKKEKRTGESTSGNGHNMLSTSNTSTSERFTCGVPNAEMSSNQLP